MKNGDTYYCKFFNIKCFINDYFYQNSNENYFSKTVLVNTKSKNDKKKYIQFLLKTDDIISTRIILTEKFNSIFL